MNQAAQKTPKHTVPREVFREYDVRGRVGDQLTPELALELGRAVGTRVRRGGGSKLVVGCDHRSSGPALVAGLVEGMRSTGCSVTEIGVTPTPVQYWAIQHLGVDGGVQVTGSHNPPEYNGFKMTLLGAALHGSEIQELLTCIEQQDYETGSGDRSELDVLDAYLDDLAEKLGPAKKKLKVVIDAGNGTGGITGLPLYERLGYEVTPLFCEPDGNFPNHHPDPTVEENLEDLRAAVADKGADLGIAFDGDADRIGVVDASGEVIWGDRLMVLFAREVLAEVPGAPIIGEVKCSKTLYDDIAAHGGQPIMWKAGHSLIKAKMKEVNAPLAGEMSGHIFFKHRYYGFDDAIYAGGRLLEILGNSDRTLAEHLADIPSTISTPEIRVDCAESIKFKVVAAVTKAFKDRAAAEGFEVVDIDGARVQWSDGWGLVRASNTQPILVLRFEADTTERLEAIRALLEAEIERATAAMS